MSSEDTKPETEKQVEENIENTEAPQMEEAIKSNRGEKKMRKVMQKFGLKPFPNVMRVAIRKGANINSITNPDVYKSPDSEVYVIFGELKAEDTIKKSQESAAEKFTAPTAPATIPEETEEADEDTTGIEEKDIELVMNNGNTTRAKAIKALRKTNNDIVNAILEVSN